MSFEKRNYVAYDTTITALNLNNIQDQIIRNEQELTALNNGYKSNLNLINSKADINHADTTEKYGLGSPDYYGHNKALNYSQAISANNKLDGLCPSIQAFQTLDNNVKNLEKELDSGLVGILKVSSSKEFPACYKIKGTDVWINPPMIPNEEYLTFEYFGGLQVYTQLVVFSENDAIKEHENDVQLKYTWNNKDDIIFITRMCGRAGGYTLPYLERTTAGYMQNMTANGKDIFIQGTNFSEDDRYNETIYSAQLWYVKDVPPPWESAVMSLR